MRMISPKIARLFGLALLLLTTAAAQEPTKRTMAYLPEGEIIRALASWRVAGKDGSLLCVVSEAAARNADELLTRSLRIYRENSSGTVELYKFASPDSIVSIFPLGDYDARLVVTWVGGSAYHFRILAFLEGQVKQVFEEGSKLLPEFLYDDHGREFVLVTEPEIKNGKWTPTNGTTTVFKWNGHGNDKPGTVAWAKRLQCVSKAACESLK